MKMKKIHVVPLAPAAVDVIEAVRPLTRRLHKSSPMPVGRTSQ